MCVFGVVCVTRTLARYAAVLVHYLPPFHLYVTFLVVLFTCQLAELANQSRPGSLCLTGSWLAILAC